MPSVINPLKQLKELNLNANVIIHSDQGAHYTSNSYKDKIQEIGLTGSMSRRGKCVDNASIETFLGHMKDEVDFKKLETYKEVVEAINTYMYKYNNLRPRWTLKKMTPVEYRNHLLNIA